MRYGFSKGGRGVLTMVLLAACSVTAAPGDSDIPVKDREALAREVSQAGWIAYSARTDRGDWDLFVMRPDGAARHPLTDTPAFNEAGIRFSPDGKRILYYRLGKTEPVANNTYGRFDLVLADADGRNPVVYGSGYPWASWGPDGTQIACLTPKGIQIVDVVTRKVARELPRQGIVQQLVWSPDGKWFLGTANGLGPYWNIGRLNAATGEINPVSEVDRYNCTPDWAPNSREVVYARGIIPEKGGRAQMWVAGGDGNRKQPLYMEATRHVYGACVSPDGQYLLFTRSDDDMGEKDSSQAVMAIIRRADTPMAGGPGASKEFPETKLGPRLDLGQGWEPHWTSSEVSK